jgi:hypothetical protein
VTGIAFNPEDPFPLLPPALRVYELEQAHASHVDAWLGLEIERVESALLASGRASPRSGAEQNWVGLKAQSLLTPYTEIREMLERLSPPEGSTIVDLGAAYGRMAFVIAEHFPGRRFVGYELVDERVREGARCLKARGATGVELCCQDLSEASFRPLPADLYFIYDFGTREAIAKTLSDLREIARDRAITVVGRGRASRDEIERRHPWLSDVCEPQHFPRYSVYKT